MCNSGQVSIGWLIDNGCPLENIKAQIPVTGSPSEQTLDKVYYRDDLYKKFGKEFIDNAYKNRQSPCP